MEPASIASEDDFQKLLSRFPELLVGDQIDRPPAHRHQGQGKVLENAITIFESHLRKRSSLAPSPALAAHAVDVELVSTPKFPFIRENNREFRRSDRSSPACWRQISQHSQALRPKFPVKIESGIHGQEPGHSGKLTGNRRGKPASGATACPVCARGERTDLGDWIRNPPQSLAPFPTLSDLLYRSNTGHPSCILRGREPTGMQIQRGRRCL